MTDNFFFCVGPLLLCLIKFENLHVVMSPHQGGLILVFREAHDHPGVSNVVVTLFCAALSAC
jgi:hypothetical protein